MAIKLHRCKNLWVKFAGHPCWRVQKALDEQGVEYEIVKEEPTFQRHGGDDPFRMQTPQRLAAPSRASDSIRV